MDQLGLKRVLMRIVNRTMKNNMKYYILEGGEQFDLTKKQKCHLINLGLIYNSGSNYYHLADGICYMDIELALKGISNE